MIERMVLFGASGDLTNRLLMPAIAEVAEAGLLAPGFAIVGSAVTDWSTEDFRQHIAEGLEENASKTMASAAERLPLPWLRRSASAGPVAAHMPLLA